MNQRLLKRNLTEFCYLAYVGKTEILNGDKHTGKYSITYADPVYYEGNISTATGLSTQEWYGLDKQYTHVLLMNVPETDIREDGLIRWKGGEYEVRAVRPSINVLAVALRYRGRITETGDA